jgi:hypothetical protein
LNGSETRHHNLAPDMAKAPLIIGEFAALNSAVFRGFPARAIKEFV